MSMRSVAADSTYLAGIRATVKGRLVLVAHFARRAEEMLSGLAEQ
ncbi:hypothetical protein [Streptomyces sp. GMY02]|nr:hypothetical protein [Streptomyces sp. GMY02]